MQIVIQLLPHQLAHMTNQQVGAFVAHLYTLKGLNWVKVSKGDSVIKPFVEIGFDIPGTASLVDSEKISGQLNDALAAYADMEPFPCPCGCGAFISVSPCLRQSGELTDKIQGLSEREKTLVQSGDRIGAIKALRERANVEVPREPNGALRSDSPGYMGLKEAKDMIDAYWESLDAGTRLDLLSKNSTHGYTHYSESKSVRNATTTPVKIKI